MRIITGSLKGRRFILPKSLKLRPTSDRTKEGMFGVLDAHIDIQNTQVLDLFAGTGNLGFEALSRGAQMAHFVEENRDAIKFIEKTARNFELSNSIYTQTDKVEEFMDRPHSTYDLIFADPPYDYPQMTQLPERILNDNWLNEDGWFILEHDRRVDFRDHPHCYFSKPYGRTIVAIFELEPVNK